MAETPDTLGRGRKIYHSICKWCGLDMTLHTEGGQAVSRCSECEQTEWGKGNRCDTCNGYINAATNDCTRCRIHKGAWGMGCFACRQLRPR